MKHKQGPELMRTYAVDTRLTSHAEIRHEGKCVMIVLTCDSSYEARVLAEDMAERWSNEGLTMPLRKNRHE